MGPVNLKCDVHYFVRIEIQVCSVYFCKIYSFTCLHATVYILCNFLSHGAIYMYMYTLSLLMCAVCYMLCVAA